jgi:hypothetical protein
LKLATNIDVDFIDKIIQQAEEKDITSFKPQHRNKAMMHTYFSWQDNPGRPLHSAVRKFHFFSITHLIGTKLGYHFRSYKSQN